MNFQKSSSRFPGANDILDHTLIPAIVGLAGILDGQIAAIDNANTLVANQIERLSVFAPRDLRIRGSSGAPHSIRATSPWATRVFAGSKRNSSRRTSGDRAGGNGEKCQ